MSRYKSLRAKTFLLAYNTSHTNQIYSMQEALLANLERSLKDTYGEEVCFDYLIRTELYTDGTTLTFVVLCFDSSLTINTHVFNGPLGDCLFSTVHDRELVLSFLLKTAQGCPFYISSNMGDSILNRFKRTLTLTTNDEVSGGDETFLETCPKSGDILVMVRDTLSYSAVSRILLKVDLDKLSPKQQEIYLEVERKLAQKNLSSVKRQDLLSTRAYYEKFIDGFDMLTLRQRDSYFAIKEELSKDITPSRRRDLQSELSYLDKLIEDWKF